MSITFLVQNGDAVLDAAGRVKTVSGATKRDQDVANALMTAYEASDSYGNEGLDLIGKAVSGVSNASLLRRAVSSAIESLKAIQRQDPYSTAEERIVGIRRLTIRPIAGSSDRFFFLLELQSEAGTLSSLSDELSMEHQQLPQQVLSLLLEGVK